MLASFDQTMERQRPELDVCKIRCRPSQCDNYLSNDLVSGLLQSIIRSSSACSFVNVVNQNQSKYKGLDLKANTSDCLPEGKVNANV